MRRCAGKIFIFLLCALICNSFLNHSLAMEVEVASSPNPVGSGARALGMGGAFIAIADDATAASWNPAGLIQLEKAEFSVVGAFFDRTEESAFGDNMGTAEEQSVSDTRLNYLSVTSNPFNIGQNFNMIFSVNYQNLYDFSRELKFSRKGEVLGKIDQKDIDYKMEGSLSAFGIACAVKPSCFRQLTFGATLNLWEDGFYRNEWEQKTLKKGSITYPDTGMVRPYYTDKFEQYSFNGINANFGFLWDIFWGGESSLTIGGVLKLPFTGDLKREKRERILRLDEDQPVINQSETDLEMKMPMSYGLGMAYRATDRFTVSLDVYRTEWDDFLMLTEDGEISPITGVLASKSDIHPTHQVRMGMEYIHIGSKYALPICAGLFYDPAPTRGGTDDFWGFSLGAGFSMEKDKDEKKVWNLFRGFAFGLAYQFRFGDDVGTSMVEAWDFSEDVREHTVYSSFIVYF